MSSMFNIQIEEVKGNQARAVFMVVHPDQRDITSSKNLALQVLVNAFFYLSEEDQAKSPLQKRFHEWLALSDGRKETVSKKAYHALSKHAPAGVASWGRDGSTYFIKYATDYNGFCQAADQLISAVWLENEIDNPRPDEESDPVADLVFTVHDATLLAHLKKGQGWDSALHDYTSYRTLWETPEAVNLAVPDLANALHKLTPFAGLDFLESTGNDIAFSADMKRLLVTNQTSELVALGGKTWDVEWRVQADPGLRMLWVGDTVASLYSSTEGESFTLEGVPTDLELPRGQVISPLGTYAVDYGYQYVHFIDDTRKMEAEHVVEALAFTADESLFAFGGMFSNLVIASPVSLKVQHTISTGERCSSLSFSPDGQYLAAIIGHVNLDIYQVIDGVRLCRLKAEHQITRVCWSPDGQFVVANHLGEHGIGGYFAMYPVRTPS